MSSVQRIQLGPDTTPLQQGRSSHGRWRYGYQSAAVTGEIESIPAALTVLQDTNRLAFALTEGPAAAFLGERLADYLWMRETVDDDWPQNLRDWLADPALWNLAPPGQTGFICGRLQRDVAGGRIHLAWLGMSGVRLLDRAYNPLTLDTVLQADEMWTPKHGPEPVGMALHAYRGSLFELRRLMLYTTGAAPLDDELPNLTGPDLQQALEDWSEEAESDLAIFDLRLHPVITEPDNVMLSYHWISPEECMLFWQQPPIATGYRIEESMLPDFSGAGLLAEMTDGRQVQYRFSPPVSSPRFYRVIPLNQGVPGEPSEPVSVTPVTLSTPILEPIQWADDGGYYLRWTPVIQATGYEIQVSASQNFEPDDSAIIYRGELPEFQLPQDTPQSRYYRIRAINVLYAPHTPSPWSHARRSPSRLDTPTFNEVSQSRIAWEPITGARQYAVQVSSQDHADVEAEMLYTIDCAIGVADQPAHYRVRALRNPNDLRTASEWSETITIAPDDASASQRTFNWRMLAPVLLAAVGVALLVGAALGLIGLEAFQNYNATSTRTPIPQAMIDVSATADQINVNNASVVPVLEQENDQFRGTLQAQEDAEATRTRIPTLTPTITPNLTETVDAAFVAGLTSTAALWTETPTPTITPNLTETLEAEFVAGLTATAVLWTETPTPSITPNTTETLEAAFAAGLTSTAVLWTETPTPSHTPNLTETVEAAFFGGLTSTAALWTETPTPSHTPNLTETVESAFFAGLTATAARWTSTPEPSETPDLTATIGSALEMAIEATFGPPQTATALAQLVTNLPAGCFVTNLPAEALPVYVVPSTTMPLAAESLPPLAQVIIHWPRSNGTLWLKVQWDEEVGWITVADENAAAALYAGSPNCQPETDIEVYGE